MDQDRKFRRQQILMLIVGVVALVVTLAMVVAFVMVDGTAQMWWTAIGPAMTTVGMLLGWRKLPVLGTQLRDAHEEPPSKPSS